MANEKISASIINTYFKTINLEDGSTKDGVMLVFSVNFPDGHPLKTKPVCKFMEGEFDLEKTGKSGWTVQFTKDSAYVNAPLIDRFDIEAFRINLKMDRAIESGLSVHV